jgi:LPS export ABC transporter protein LptC
MMRLHALLLCAALLAGCNGATAPPVGDYEPLPASSVIMGLEQRMTSDGVRRALLRADTAFIFEDSSVTHLRVVHLDMFSDDGRLTTTVTSETAEYNQSTQKTVARGNVVLVMPEAGRTIWTEELHYDPQQKRVWSDVPVRMVEAGREFRGQRFTADDQFNNINIPGGAGSGLPLPVPSVDQQ